MATSPKTLIPLLSSIVLLLTLANTAQSLPKKTSFSHDFTHKKQNSGLTYQGDAHFPSDTTVLRLTKTDASGNPQQYSIGRVIYSKPVIFSEKKKQADFQTTVKFIIKPNNGDYNPADGLLFFIAPFNSSIGDSGGSFGVFDPFGRNPSVFAVEFDIYFNEDYDPPTYRHVGIDIQSHISSNVTEVDDAILGQEVSALIAYDATTKLISVHGTAGSKKFEVTYVYDLSTILPPLVQVGISATTGMSVAVHDVISWSFNSALGHIK